MLKRRAFKILWQSAFACALLLGGWGFTHLGSFFADPARAAFLFFLLARNAGETLSLNRDPFSSKKEIGGFQRWVPALSRLTMAFLCGFLPFADSRNILTFTDIEAVRFVGSALFFVGGMIQLVALRALGREYSVHVTLQDDHKLVQAGVYSFIRHPIYLGLLLNMLGVPLVFRSWLVLPVSAVSLFFIVSRITQEEMLLAQEFGPEFESYRQRTKFLVPYLC